MNNQIQKSPYQTPYPQLVLFIAITPLIFPTFASIFNIHIGTTIEGIITISFYAIGSVISWYWELIRASIGWLLFTLGASILLITGVNDSLALMAFFACLISGFGFLISEGISQKQSKPPAG